MSSRALCLIVSFAIMAPLAEARAQDHGREHGGKHREARDEVLLYHNLGSLHHEITTSVPAAQLYFDQGLRLLYAFSHAESARSFSEPERLDPACAMCSWGVALALGPNINAPMDSVAGIAAYDPIQRALERADRASAREQAYVRALARR